MTIGMLGCGNMGGAIASALVQEGKDTVLAVCGRSQFQVL